jgi:hypothetical protein
VLAHLGGDGRLVALFDELYEPDVLAMVPLGIADGGLVDGQRKMDS